MAGFMPLYPFIVSHMLVHFVLHAGDRFDAARDDDRHLSTITRCAAIAIVCRPEEQ